MDSLISLIRGIISQCMCISKHHIIHLKYIYCSFVNHISVKPEKKEREQLWESRVLSSRSISLMTFCVTLTVAFSILVSKIKGLGRLSSKVVFNILQIKFSDLPEQLWLICLLLQFLPQLY